MPRDLRIVALLFLLGGLLPLAAMISSGEIDLRICGVWGIPVFLGLRNFSPWWRTFALVCSGLVFSASLMMLLMAIPYLIGYGDPGHSGRAVTICLIMMFLTWWQSRGPHKPGKP